jgi:dTDP-4-amino-4,6-dideoxygalactose transaminase
MEAEFIEVFKRVFSHHEWILGREVQSFEKSWLEFLGVKYAIGCANGTDALSLALQALDIREGDEVITSSLSFFATAESILSRGARIVFVDVLPESGLIDPAKIVPAITPKTKAVMPIHLYGQPCQMDEILKISRDFSIFCIEDAAQAHGVFFQEKALGTWGDMGCFSFFPGKNLGALGDAGAIVTDQKKYEEKLRALRDHGRSAKYAHQLVGSNKRMDGLQAGFLTEKLKKLQEWDSRRREITAIYQEGLSGISGLVLPPAKNLPISRGSLHLYVLCHPKRDQIANLLNQAGIETGVHYPIPCHLQDAFKNLGPFSPLPATEAFSAECLSLPLSGTMPLTDAEKVVNQLKSILRKF